LREAKDFLKLVGVHSTPLIDYITKLHEDELFAELKDSNLYRSITNMHEMSPIGFVRKFDK